MNLTKVIKSNVFLIAIIGILLVALAGTFFYFNQQLGYLKNRNIFVLQDQSGQLIDELSKIYDVPTDETPTIVEINNPEQLKNQPFFAKAQKGDKLFIYLKSQKAILYNPADNKIVNVDVANVVQPSNKINTP